MKQMDDQKDMVSITVLIAGRPYPLRIKTTEEPSIRKIVKEINNQINSFQLKYTTKDKQDCLSMVALTYAVDLAKARSNNGNTPPTTTSADHSAIFDQLSALDSLLDHALDSK